MELNVYNYVIDYIMTLDLSYHGVDMLLLCSIDGID